MEQQHFSNPPPPTPGGPSTPEPPDQLDRIEALLRRVLDLQRFDDFTTPHALQSGVSKSCSANSNGCEPHCEVITTPPPPQPQPQPPPAG
jgi:hypothetical protein